MFSQTVLVLINLVQKSNNLIHFLEKDNSVASRRQRAKPGFSPHRRRVLRSIAQIQGKLPGGYVKSQPPTVVSVAQPPKAF